MNTPEHHNLRPATFEEYLSQNSELVSTDAVEYYFNTHLAICHALLKRLEIALRQPNSSEGICDALGADIGTLRAQLNGMGKIEQYLVEQLNNRSGN